MALIKMTNQNETNPLHDDQLAKVLQKVNEVAQKSAGDRYIYRGETQCFANVSSGLFRQFQHIVAEHFNIEAVQQEIIEAARQFTTETDDFEILTQLQHYGCRTNLVDFTTDQNIALFFACDGDHDRKGRVILLREADIPYVAIIRARTPANRVIAQKSVFVRPSEGYLKASDLVEVPPSLKQPILEFLRGCVRKG